MAIHFKCSNPDCRKPMRAPDGTEGKKASCPFCNTVQVIPSPVEETPGSDTFGPIDFSDESFAEQPASSEGQKICPECNTPIPAGTSVCPKCGHIAGTENLTDQFSDSGPAVDGQHVMQQTKHHNALFLALAGVGALCAIVAVAFILMGNGEEKKEAPQKPPKTVTVPAAEQQPAKPDKLTDSTVAKQPAAPAVPVMDARTKAIRDRSIEMIKQVSTQLFKAAVANEGKFPDNPQVMQLAASMLRSPANPNQSFQFIPGQSLDEPENIVMYDPAGYMGTYVALQAGGEVEVFDSLGDLQKKLDSQKMQ